MQKQVYILKQIKKKLPNRSGEYFTGWHHDHGLTNVRAMVRRNKLTYKQVNNKKNLYNFIFTGKKINKNTVNNPTAQASGADPSR